MIFSSKDKGLHKDYLTSFELALRDAAISDLNLVSVSSIMPPECKIVIREEGRKHPLPGQIAFTVMAKSATNEPKRLIAASIGLARPADHSQYGQRIAISLLPLTLATSENKQETLHPLWGFS
jgi:arginine decarboxylase